MEGESIELPRWWASARGAVWRRQRITLHLGWPAALAEQPGNLRERGLVSDPRCLAFEHQVDALQSDRERAGGLRRQVARLARPRTAGQVQGAVVPGHANAGRMRPAVRAHRA